MVSTLKLTKIQIPNSDSDVLSFNSSTGIMTFHKDIKGEGTATTNLQQGLAKSWINYAQNGDTIKDSLNISSVADNSTSEFNPVMTNVMANINYSVHGSYAPNYGTSSSLGFNMHQDGTAERAPTTADYFVRTIGFNGSGFDSKYNMLSLDGDLA